MQFEWEKDDNECLMPLWPLYITVWPLWNLIMVKNSQNIDYFDENANTNVHRMILNYFMKFICNKNII